MIPNAGMNAPQINATLASQALSTDGKMVVQTYTVQLTQVQLNQQLSQLQNRVAQMNTQISQANDAIAQVQAQLAMFPQVATPAQSI